MERMALQYIYMVTSANVPIRIDMETLFLASIEDANISSRAPKQPTEDSTYFEFGTIVKISLVKFL